MLKCLYFSLLEVLCLSFSSYEQQQLHNRSCTVDPNSKALIIVGFQWYTPLSYKDDTEHKPVHHLYIQDIYS